MICLCALRTHMDGKVLISQLSGGEPLRAVATAKSPVDTLVPSKSPELCEGGIAGCASVDRHGKRL